MDAVDELVECRAQQSELSPMLKRVHRFHKTNPHVLDFLVLELRAERESGWTRTSLGNIWHYARWVISRKNCIPGETFAMSNSLFPHYSRIIAILHPEFNGFFAMAKSQADKDFGTALDPRSDDPVRRLQWADGTAIEYGGRPSTQHEPKPVRRRPRVQRAA